MYVLLISLIVLTVINMIMCVPQGQELIARLMLIPIVLTEKLWYWIRPQIGATYLKSEINFGENPDTTLYRIHPSVEMRRDFPQDTNLYRIDTRRRVWRWQRENVS